VGEDYLWGSGTAATSVEFVAPDSNPTTSRRQSGCLFGIAFLGFAGWSIGSSLHHYLILGVLGALIFLDWSLIFVRWATFNAGKVIFDESLAERVGPAVYELCMRAGCPVPRIALRSGPSKPASVRSPRPGTMTLVLSSNFVHSTNDEQLRSTIAHEVVHVAHNDPKMHKIAALMLRMTVGVSVLAVYICTVRLHLAFPLYVAAAFMALLVIRAPLSLLYWRSEFRADREGAILTGQPTQMASALTEATRFVRSMSHGSPGERFWRVIFAPVSYTAPTHPPVARRVRRLEQMVVAD
jgi:heat shock protein HtpX